jgi:hypothetical protein
MTDPAPSFAIIPVPYGKPPAGAIAHGPLSAVFEHVLGSRARADAEALVKRAADAAEQEREREQREQEVLSDGIRTIADGVAKLSRRLDLLLRSRDARRRLDFASEATKQMLELPKDAPSPDRLFDAAMEPGGELHPLQAKDPAEHQPKPDDQGALPNELERGAPPETGNYPSLEDPSRKQAPQPVSISLNKEC